MRKFLLTGLAALFCSSGAQAVPILASEGNDYLFNFDFASAGTSPAPPYFWTTFYTGVQSETVDSADSGTWHFYSDLNAGNPFLVQSYSSLYLFGIGTNSSAWTDGVFSVVLRMTSGSILLDPTADAYVRTSNTTMSYSGRHTPMAVAEPGTLALLGFGLVALLVTRSCRRRVLVAA